MKVIIFWFLFYWSKDSIKIESLTLFCTKHIHEKTYESMPLPISFPLARKQHRSWPESVQIISIFEAARHKIPEKERQHLCDIQAQETEKKRQHHCRSVPWKDHLKFHTLTFLAVFLVAGKGDLLGVCVLAALRVFARLFFLAAGPFTLLKRGTEWPQWTSAPSWWRTARHSKERVGIFVAANHTKEDHQTEQKRSLHLRCDTTGHATERTIQLADHTFSRKAWPAEGTLWQVMHHADVEPRL